MSELLFQIFLCTSERLRHGKHILSAIGASNRQLPLDKSVGGENYTPIMSSID
jgi:hypothetical protein